MVENHDSQGMPEEAKGGGGGSGVLRAGEGAGLSLPAEDDLNGSFQDQSPGMAPPHTFHTHSALWPQLALQRTCPH